MKAMTESKTSRRTVEQETAVEQLDSESLPCLLFSCSISPLLEFEFTMDEQQNR
jgi:hypothetical protein